MTDVSHTPRDPFFCIVCVASLVDFILRMCYVFVNNRIPQGRHHTHTHTAHTLSMSVRIRPRLLLFIGILSVSLRVSRQLSSCVCSEHCMEENATISTRDDRPIVGQSIDDDVQIQSSSALRSPDAHGSARKDLHAYAALLLSFVPTLALRSTN